MASFKCPFCGKELTVVNSRLLMCNDCNLAVDLSSKRAWVVSGAPEHVLETMRFLELLPKLDPRFVLSRFPLFSKDFKVHSCKFFGCEKSSAEVECVDFSNFVQSKDYYLIAGKHLITQNLVKLFRCSLTGDYNYFPLKREHYADYTFELWMAVMLMSVTVNDKESRVLADAYFSPSLENMIQILWHKFPTGRLASVSDEQAMYSMVFCEPDVNIVWENNIDGMRNRLISFVKACLKDVSSVPFKINNKYNLKKLPFLNSKWNQDFTALYYKSMPSTAVNQDGAGDVCFDILNHEFVCDYFSSYPEESIDAKVFMVLTNIYRSLGTFWERYASKHAIYGTRMKQSWLKQCGRKVPTDLNEMVLEFWKEMEKELQHEES